MSWFRRSNKTTDVDRVARSLKDEPPVQFRWFAYKCRLCGQSFDATWHYGDSEVQIGYEMLSWKSTPANKVLSAWNPPSTCIHPCSDTEAGIADLLGAKCRAANDKPTGDGVDKQK